MQKLKGECAVIKRAIKNQREKVQQRKTNNCSWGSSLWECNACFWDRTTKVGVSWVNTSKKKLFRQDTAVLEFLELLNSFVNSRHKFYINEIRKMARDKCPFYVTAQKENLYAQKEGNQIDEGSYALNSICQETIVKNLNNKIKKALSRMGIKKLSDQNKYLIKSPMMASCSLRSA